MIIDFNLNTNSGGGGAISKSFIVVETLPTASQETANKIYVIAAQGEGEDHYDEYVTIDHGAEAATRYTWEQLGATRIDEEGLTETISRALNQLRNEKTTVAQVTEMIVDNIYDGTDRGYTNKALSARQGKRLQDQIDSINDDMSYTISYALNTIATYIGLAPTE